MDDMDEMIDFDDDTAQAEFDSMQSNTASSESVYPDGFGLSISEVQALLAKQNETIVAKDDPILLTVTILNAFLYENEKLSFKYNSALKTIYSEQNENYLQSIRNATAEIKETLSSVSVEGLRKVHTENMVQIVTFQNSLWWACGIIGVSAMINVCAFILR